MGTSGGKPLARQRSYSIEFKRQVAQGFLGGAMWNILAVTAEQDGAEPVARQAAKP